MPGLSGHAVLDADLYKDTYAGDGVLSSDEEETPTVITGGLGNHRWYLKHPGAVYSNAAGDMPKGIDVRADGGYVILPPSVHISGRQYQWELDSALWEMEPKLLPERIHDMLVTASAKARTHTAAFSTPMGVTTPAPDLARWPISAAMRRLVDTPQPVGRRSETDYRVCLALVYAGAADDDILAVFEHHIIGQRGKFADAGRRYLELTIGKARGYADANPRPTELLAQLRNWINEQDLAQWLTHRTANGQYRTLPPDRAAANIVLAVFEERGQVEGHISAAQLAQRMNCGVNSAARALDRLCTGILDRVETDRPQNGAFRYRLSAAVYKEGAGLVHKWRVSITDTNKKSHAPFMNKSYFDHLGDDVFCQSMTPITTDQVAERVATGRLYAPNYRTTLQRRLAATLPSAGRMVLILIDTVLQHGGTMDVKQLDGHLGRGRLTWHRAIQRAVDLSLVEVDARRLYLRADWEQWLDKISPEMPTYGSTLRRAVTDCNRRERAIERATAGGAAPPAWAERWQELIAHRRPGLDRAAVAYKQRLAQLVDRAQLQALIDTHRTTPTAPLTPVDKALKRLTPKGTVHTGGNRLSNRELPGYMMAEDIYEDEELDLLADRSFSREQAYATCMAAEVA